jgi:hypothetical protein
VAFRSPWGARVIVNDVGVSLSGEGSDSGVAAAPAEEIVSAGGVAVASTDNVSDCASAQRIIACAATFNCDQFVK